MKRERYYSLIASLSILVSAVAATYLAIMLALAEESPLVVPGFALSVYPRVDLDLRVDWVSATIALVASWLGFLISLYSWDYMRGDPGYGRFFSLVSLFIGGMMMLVLADNLIVMFVGWEITGLCSYALISFWHENPPEKWVGRPGRFRLGFPMFFTPTESGVRALSFTMLGDAWLLAGLAGLVYFTRAYSFTDLSSSPGSWMTGLAEAGMLLPVFAFITVGALAKSAQMPFHEWLLTAMTAPTPVSALIHAATMVNAGVYLFLRLALVSLEAVSEVESIPHTLASQLGLLYAGVAAVSLATSIALSLTALASDELKVVLASSTSSQLGLMFASASAGGLLASKGLIAEAMLACYASLVHLVSHALFKATLFLASGWIMHAAHSRFLDDMKGALRGAKLTAFSFAIGSLSLAGIPPSLGFISKEMVLHSLKESHAALLAPGLAGVVLTSLYTGRLLGLLLTKGEDHSGGESGEREYPLMVTTYSLISLTSMALGVLWLTGSGVGTAVLRLVDGDAATQGSHVFSWLAVASVSLSSGALLSAFLSTVKGSKPHVLPRGWRNALVMLLELAYDRFLATPLIYATLSIVRSIAWRTAWTAHTTIDCAITPLITLFATSNESRLAPLEPARPIGEKLDATVGRVDATVTTANRTLGGLEVKVVSASKTLPYKSANGVSSFLYSLCLKIQEAMPVYLKRLNDALRSLDYLYHGALVDFFAGISTLFRSIVRRGDISYTALAYIVSALVVAFILLLISLILWGVI